MCMACPDLLRVTGRLYSPVAAANTVSASIFQQEIRKENSLWVNFFKFVFNSNLRCKATSIF